MNITQVMTSDVKTVKPTDNVKNAVETMSKNHIGSVIVADETEALGIITEHDVLTRVVLQDKNANKVLCKDIMSKPLVAIDPSTEIAEAIDIMVRRKIKNLVVLEDDELVGIVTATDVLRSGKMLEEEALNKLSRFFYTNTPEEPSEEDYEDEEG